MLKELWGVSIKVPDLEKELTFHQQLGNRICGDYLSWNHTVHI